MDESKMVLADRKCNILSNNLFVHKKFTVFNRLFEREGAGKFDVERSGTRANEKRTKESQDQLADIRLEH